MQYLFNAFQQTFSPIHLKAVTEKELHEINKSLKWKTSYLYDEIPSWIVISSPMFYICNTMLSTGSFPTRLKFSQVFPIFKKGNKTEMSDYRPVTLLISFSKIFEKVIYNRLLQHTKENNIIVMDQYGFKSNSSTELAIFNLTNQIQSHINNKPSVCGIFCDLTEAFDFENHILISKLEYYGIIGRTGELIKSY
jgi:Notch-like protein